MQQERITHKRHKRADQAVSEETFVRSDNRRERQEALDTDVNEQLDVIDRILAIYALEQTVSA